MGFRSCAGSSRTLRLQLMPRDQEPSYDSDPRLSQSLLLTATMAAAFVGGILLIISGLR